MDKNWMIYANERGLQGTLHPTQIDPEAPSGEPICGECNRVMWECICKSECTDCGATVIGPYTTCEDCWDGGYE